MEKGLVCDIQRFCLHDGPGIRTVVFFKGCPLRCEWCCNPESQTDKKQLFYIKTKCVGCRRCVAVCKNHCISGTADGKIEIDRGVCTGCMRCAECCVGSALKEKGKMWGAEELAAEIAADKTYYKESGGGVTLSGGEVLAQPDFAYKILSISKETGINTAIETSGYGEPDSLMKLCDAADFILFDIKHANSEKHERFTGVPNDLILKNLEAVLAVKRDCLFVRVPLIPNVNTDNKSLDEIKALLLRLNIEKIELLPYHRLGNAKYGFLGIGNRFEHIDSIGEGELARIRDYFSNDGILAADCAGAT